MGSIDCDMGAPFVSALVYVPDDCMYKARNAWGRVKYFPKNLYPMALQWLQGGIE
jgi:hypothetical protein